LYAEDAYVIVDGPKCIRALPTRGVKQGCPLSPLLLSLNINSIVESVEGVLTGPSNIRVTHMLYTDDLCLTADRPDQTQTMLDRSAPHAKRKGLSINAAKSEVVHYNPPTLTSPLSVWGVLR